VDKKATKTIFRRMLYSFRLSTVQCSKRYTSVNEHLWQLHFIEWLLTGLDYNSLSYMWRASPPWVVILLCLSIGAPKTRRVVTSATGVVALLHEFQPAADGYAWRSGRRGRGRGVCGQPEYCLRSLSWTLGERVTSWEIYREFVQEKD